MPMLTWDPRVLLTIFEISGPLHIENILSSEKNNKKMEKIKK